MPAFVDLINRALVKLGQPTVMSDTDSSPNATRAVAIWPTTRQFLLRSYPWKFAKKSVTLAASTTAPDDSDFDNSFTLPSDYIRLVTANDPDSDIRGRSVYSNETSLKIEYIYDVEDVSLYDPCFVEAAACYLAAELCIPITADMNLKMSIQKDFAYHIKLAKSVGSVENPIQLNVNPESFINSRRSFSDA